MAIDRTQQNWPAEDVIEINTTLAPYIHSCVDNPYPCNACDWSTVNAETEDEYLRRTR